MLFEVRCAGCGVLGWCPCSACIEALVDPEPALVPGARSVALLFSHSDVGREFIHALKYRGERAIAGWLGESLALAHLAALRSIAPIDTAAAGLAPIDTAAAGLAPIDTAAAGLAPIDTVTWAPTTAAHRRARGFDQAETLARATAKALRARPMRLLRRIGGTAQSGASREERLAGPRFDCRRVAAGRRILLVDDVVTTGATLRAATAVLTDAGAAAVHVAACARRGRDRNSAAA
ncbi:ComF family protein [Candidatus Poriferisodalis sp.]|uniref:ComF family protein n=1 Tax=Candidatus Poriferisodalis sp. TaxID=3101277 RepID=UPI003B5B708A